MRRIDAMLTRIPTRNKEEIPRRLRSGIWSLKTMKAGRMVQRKSVSVLMMPTMAMNMLVLKHLYEYVGWGSQAALSGLWLKLGGTTRQAYMVGSRSNIPALDTGHDNKENLAYSHGHHESVEADVMRIKGV